MTAAGVAGARALPVSVLEPRCPLDDRAIDAVRDCLGRIGDGDRVVLWNLLEPVIRARDAGNPHAAVGVVNTAPAGPIRECLARIVRPMIAAERDRPFPTTTIDPTSAYVRGRARPDFLGLYRGLQGTVAPVDVWASRGLYWERTDPDAFAGVNVSGRTSDPKPLDYRHDPGRVVGCSRRWHVDDTGALHGRFDIGSHPEAQHAARAAQAGDLGLSMTVRFRTRWLAHPAPDEWSPADGILDVCVRDDAAVESVALTPSPTYPTATVDRVW